MTKAARRRRRGCQWNRGRFTRLGGEAPRPLDFLAPASRDGHERRHVVGHALLGRAAVGDHHREQAAEQVVGGFGDGVAETVQPGVAQRCAEHVELVEHAVDVVHADALLPVELQLLARRRLVPGMGLRALVGNAADDVAAQHVGRQRVVAGQFLVRMAVEKVLVNGLLRRPGQRGLLLDDVSDGVEGARALGPGVLYLAARLPVLRDGVAVQAVAPTDLGEVRGRSRLPVHVQLSHDVPFQPDPPPRFLASRGRIVQR